MFEGSPEEYEALRLRQLRRKKHELIKTLRSETRPVKGHPDHGAIEDCWEELKELIGLR
jgi:hypothetical protein